MIPPFHDNNNLPPGRHACSLQEIRTRFANGEKRQRLFDQLCGLIERARDCGFRQLVIFGSFVTAKAEPGDIDFFWVAQGGTDTSLLRQECRQLLDTMHIKNNFGFDAFWCPDEPDAIERMTMLWSEDRNRQQRGLLVLDLV
jgi:hypothetical protein